MRICLENVRKQAPLVHCITNYVTMNDVANMILACGAKPIMADDAGEVEEITAASKSLVINIGTLQQQRIPAMLAAGKCANRLGHAVLLDPVGVGASRLRMETVQRLRQEISFDVIRGNMSEIKALVGGLYLDCGVDASSADAVSAEHLAETVVFAKEAARKLGSIVAITGALDLISDGEKCYVISNGRPEMSHITGTGCMLSGMMAAYLAVGRDEPLVATAASVCAMGLAGEIAWNHLDSGEGNATYRNRLIDAVYQMEGDTLERGAKYEVR